MLNISKYKFVGGPRDGEECGSELATIPLVIDGRSVHYFGDEAYALTQINNNEGYALFEHMLLVKEPNEANSL